jgi:hypothetical protein
MSVPILLSAMSAYDAAVQTADWQGAITALMRARGALVAIPQSEHGEFRFEFRNAATIDGMIADCRKNLAASRPAGGLQFIPVELQREPHSDCY